ncbi:hypothetical protein AURDEDRAFT_167379 [Auricularia subglabra TFB-10046 SS5]|nr:hypothetical protein AURDEDRAFT_167379 [Auricularia subglabra TFB-10046 SS5]
MSNIATLPPSDAFPPGPLVEVTFQDADWTTLRGADTLAQRLDSAAADNTTVTVKVDGRLCPNQVTAALQALVGRMSVVEGLIIVHDQPIAQDVLDPILSAAAPNLTRLTVQALVKGRPAFDQFLPSSSLRSLFVSPALLKRWSDEDVGPSPSWDSVQAFRSFHDPFELSVNIETLFAMLPSVRQADIDLRSVHVERRRVDLTMPLLSRLTVRHDSDASTDPHGRDLLRRIRLGNNHDIIVRGGAADALNVLHGRAPLNTLVELRLFGATLGRVRQLVLHLPSPLNRTICWREMSQDAFRNLISCPLVQSATKLAIANLLHTSDALRLAHQPLYAHELDIHILDADSQGTLARNCPEATLDLLTNQKGGFIWQFPELIVLRLTARPMLAAGSVCGPAAFSPPEVRASDIARFVTHGMRKAGVEKIVLEGVQLVGPHDEALSVLGGVAAEVQYL